MFTKTGKRTAYIRVQIVEDSPQRITLFFPGNPQPLAFTPEPRITHFERLRAILDAHPA